MSGEDELWKISPNDVKHCIICASEIEVKGWKKVCSKPCCRFTFIDEFVTRNMLEYSKRGKVQFCYACGCSVRDDGKYKTCTSEKCSSRLPVILEDTSAASACPTGLRMTNAAAQLQSPGMKNTLKGSRTTITRQEKETTTKGEKATLSGVNSDAKQEDTSALDGRPELRMIYNLPLAEWHNVGIELGIHENELKVVQKNNFGDFNAQKREMFSIWLHQDVKATYRRLVEVLMVTEQESAVILSKCLGFSLDAFIPSSQSPNSVSRDADRGTKRTESCTLPVNDVSIVKPEYYTIALLGKSGQGKSTTGNKLLQIRNEASSVSKQYPIKEWRCSDISLLKWYRDAEPKSFAAASCAESVTKQCQMLSNETTKIRVMDIPGFADSKGDSKTTVERNAQLVDTVIQIQRELTIRFHRILYFLPTRGALERADAYIQDELKALYYYFGDSIFKCMVIIATKHDYEPTEFHNIAYDRTVAVILYIMKEVTKQNDPICPPVVYIPFNATPKKILELVQDVITNNSSLDPTERFESYCGDEHWDEWIKHFDEICTLKSLHNLAKLKMMKSLLTGNTKAVVDKLSEDVTYDEAKYKLQQHIYAAKYANRMKTSDEEWKDFADDLCILAKMAFPDKQESSIKEMVIAIVLQKSHLVLASNLPYDSIITIVTATEAITAAFTVENMGNKWANWITDFENITTVKKLDDCTKVQWLKARLAGKALEIFNKMSEKKTYTETKDEFCKELHAFLFQTRVKLHAERWDTYADELKTLAKIGYPEVEQEKRILKHILDQVNNSELKSRTWNTLDEAVIVITAKHEILNIYADKTGKSWQSWLAEFGKKCGILDERKKLKWVQVCISDDLLPLFQTVCNEKQGEYVKVTKAFQESLVAQDCFESRKKLPTEEWVELCDHLSSLATAFVPEKDRDAVVLNKLSTIFKNRSISLGKKPETLKEARELLSKMKTISKYSGEGSWENWLQNFQLGISLCDDEQGKIKLFKDNIEAKALELFNDLKYNATVNYETMIRMFEVQLYMYRFESRRKQLTEGWEQFANDLRKIAEKAYHLQDIREMKVLKQFTSDSAVKKDIIMLNPESIKVAVDICIAMDCIMMYCGQLMKVSWEEWIEYFENTADKYNLNRTSKVLCACLTDNARKVFLKQKNILDKGYEDAKYLFEKELYKDWFVTRQRSECECIDTFVSHLKSLAVKAYSEPETEANKALSLKLRNAIENGRGVKFPPDWPDTIDDGVKTFKVLEAMKYSQFTCDKDWDEWVSYFENTVHGVLGDHTKLQCFVACISKDAEEHYGLKRNYYAQNFENGKKYIREAFYMKKFHRVAKQDHETWSKICRDLDGIAIKAYTGAEREGKVLSHFKEKVQLFDEKMYKKLVKENPKNAHWAANLLEYWEMELKGVELKIIACTRCRVKAVLEQNTIVEDHDGKCVPYAETKCHAEMTDKHTRFEKIAGGIGHIFTLGFVLIAEKVTDQKIKAWQGFTNSDKVCCSCRKEYRNDGCMSVKQKYTIQGKECTVDHVFK